MKEGRIPEVRMRELKWVVLDCPAKQWENPLVRDLYSKMVHLKLVGYRSVYPENVLPIDTTDYVGNHQLICEEDPYGGLHPILASKSITLERCREHGLPFAGRNLALNAEGDAHLRAVDLLVADCERRGAGLTYDSSWTNHPRCRDDREYRKLLKDMYTAIFYRVHEKLGIEDCLMGGVLRFRTHEFFRGWGARPLELDGRELGTIRVKPLIGEEVQMLAIRRFSDEARETAERFRAQWESCLWLEPRAQARVVTLRRKAA